jgi:hypothetical protein
MPRKAKNCSRTTANLPEIFQINLLTPSLWGDIKNGPKTALGGKIVLDGCREQAGPLRQTNKKYD